MIKCKNLSENQLKKTEAIMFLLVSSLLVFGGMISIKTIFPNAFHDNNQILVTENNTKENIFEEPSITAKSAVVYDINSDTFIYKKDSETSRPIASITKVVSALVSADYLVDGDKIKISKEAISQSDDNGLLLDEIWSFKKLLDFSLMVSSNDGAYAIANIVGSFSKHKLENEGSENNSVDIFVQKMNQKVSTLGLSNTYFNNPSGLDVDSIESGGYSNAEEIAKLFAYTIKNNPRLLEATSKQEEMFVSDNNISHDAKNTNGAFASIPSLLASKTGYTELAGGNLAIIYDVGVNNPVVVVVLGSGYNERFDDVRYLVETTNNYFAI